MDIDQKQVFSVALGLVVGTLLIALISYGLKKAGIVGDFENFESFENLEMEEED